MWTIEMKSARSGLKRIENCEILIFRYFKVPNSSKWSGPLEKLQILM